jgi:uncharacterized protein (TIGR00730 family)
MRRDDFLDFARSIRGKRFSGQIGVKAARMDKNSKENNGYTSLPRSSKTIRQVKNVPKTPQTQSAAYRLAFADDDFMTRRELRPVRLQLELLKTEMALAEYGITSTVVLFGGARIPEPGKAAWAAKNAKQRERLEANSRYYDEARRFAHICSEHSAQTNYREYVIVTGGGPGVMEAGNRGANDAGAPTIGLNIVLPHEQAPNAYVTPDLSFNFHYFAIRKMHFLMRAKAVAAFPGGFGTMDELFECLTLMQTGRMKQMPVLLFGKEFWQRIINFEALAEEGVISPEDVHMVTFVDSAEEAWKVIADYYSISADDQVVERVT